MSEPHDDEATRPISVAELLARHGNIGSPPVTGRRRRRRGGADEVSVAELTGEIPVIRDDQPVPVEVAEAEPAVPDVAEVAQPAEPPAAIRPEPVRFSEPEPRWPRSSPYVARRTGPVRSSNPLPTRSARVAEETAEEEVVSAAEQMSPDPVDDYLVGPVAVGVETGAVEAAEFEAGEERAEAAEEPARPPRRRGLLGTLRGRFGRDETALAAEAAGAEDAEESEGFVSAEFETAETAETAETEAEESEVAGDAETADTDLEPDIAGLAAVEPAPESVASRLLRGGWIAVQSVLAVAFGAGLFVAFDQLWRWNSVVALVLTALVTVSLAGAVRAVRKTEDIGSTLAAVVVGLLVTVGPLVLLLSG